MTVETDPIDCWWRTSAIAVRVGEPFSFVLTCSVLESESVKVVPDQSALEPSVIQMPPFEVIGGSHPPDLRAGDRRFFQYEYQLRLIGEDLFGKDVPLPQMKVTYRLQSQVSQGSSVEGRDRLYLLPPESIRVLSLVPADAAAIRDGSSEDFADIDARSFRANALLVVAGIVFALAALVGILIIVKLAGQYREKRPVARRLVGDGAVLRSVRKELAAIESERAGGGWSRELVGRALAATRIAGSYAMARRLIETAADGNGEPVPEGTVRVRGLWPPGREVLVSASVTAEGVTQELSKSNGRGRPGRDLPALEELAGALRPLNVAYYATNGTLDDSALDDSLAASRRLQRRAAKRNTWMAKRLRAIWQAPVISRVLPWGR
jgi:hypothetical protein